MADKELVSLEVSPKLVQGVLEERIQAAIVAQLGDGETLLKELISRALHQKVDEDGKYNSSDYRNRYEFLEIITANSIRKAAKESLQEWLKQNSDKVRATVLKELKKPSRQKSLAKAYADAIEESLKCRWSMNCNIDFVRKDDDCD